MLGIYLPNGRRRFKRFFDFFGVGLIFRDKEWPERHSDQSKNAPCPFFHLTKGAWSARSPRGRGISPRWRSRQLRVSTSLRNSREY